MEKIYAIILAGGLGVRSESKMPKQLMNFNGKSLLEYTISVFNDNSLIDEIIVVMNKEYMHTLYDLQKSYSKVTKTIPGGNTRRRSTNKALKIIEEEDALVLIHDAVRPFVSHSTINRCVQALNHYEAVYPVVDSADTLVEVEANNLIKRIPSRKNMKRGQTPQGFSLSMIKEAHRLAELDIDVENEVTNDCGLINRYQLTDIKVIEGNRENIKITFPEDVLYLKHLNKINEQNLS